MSKTFSDLSELRSYLVAKLEALEGASQSTAENRRPVELDQTTMGRLSRVDALQGQAMAQATERMRGQEVARIKAALARIDEGEYGYCTTCGEEIAAKRLATDPTIPICIRCASGSR
jgi:DnaK suppressor protein